MAEDNMNNLINNFKNMLNTNNNSNNQNPSSSSSDGNLNITPDMINNLASMLQSNNFSNNSNNDSTSPSAEGSNSSCDSSSSENTNSNNSSFNIDFETILKMKSIMETLNKKDDPRSNLLYSLKPYLRESKQKKLDQYANLFKITQVAGLFNNHKGDEN